MMKKRIRKFIIKIVIVLTIISSITIITSAESIHVYSAFDNNIDHTEYYKDIQIAINNANESDTIYIHTGEFLVYDTIVIDKPLEIIGIGNGTHTMQQLFQNESMVLFEINAENVTITNMNITASEIFVITIQLNENNAKISNNTINNTFLALYVNGSSHTTIEHNVLSNNGVKGLITSLSDTTNNKILNNIFENNLKGGITLFNANNYNIENNSFNDHNDFGLSMISTNNNQISNNVFENNDHGGIYQSTSSYNQIKNNNLVGDGTNGIYLYDSNNITIGENSITDFKVGINISNFSKDTNLYENIFSRNGIDIYSINKESQQTQINQSLIIIGAIIIVVLILFIILYQKMYRQK